MTLHARHVETRKHTGHVFVNVFQYKQIFGRSVVDASLERNEKYVDNWILHKAHEKLP